LVLKGYVTVCAGRVQKRSKEGEDEEDESRLKHRNRDRKHYHVKNANGSKKTGTNIIGRKADVMGAKRKGIRKAIGRCVH